MALSLISVNIEWDKHLDTVLPFLKEHPADVVCVQELLEKDLPLFVEAAGPCVAYAPVCYLDRPDGMQTVGEALFTRLPVSEVTVRYYVGSPDTVRIDDTHSDVGTHVCVAADIGEEKYRIITTHFTWSPRGEVNDDQRRDLIPFFNELESFGEFALCGDFNAPRGKEIFSLIAQRYKDNIPQEYIGSLDPALHKTRDNPIERERIAKFMIDGLFTTPAYTANNVQLQFGVSDHAAVVATIEKTA